VQYVGLERRQERNLIDAIKYEKKLDIKEMQKMQLNMKQHDCSRNWKKYYKSFLKRYKLMNIFDFYPERGESEVIMDSYMEHPKWNVDSKYRKLELNFHFRDTLDKLCKATNCSMESLVEHAKKMGETYKRSGQNANLRHMMNNVNKVLRRHKRDKKRILNAKKQSNVAKKDIKIAETKNTKINDNKPNEIF